MKEWYEDIDLYHKIGYLVASESNSLQSLINDSKDITKTTFQNSLDSLIANSINFLKEYSDLSYENKTDYGLSEGYYFYSMWKPLDKNQMKQCVSHSINTSKKIGA